MGTPGTAAIRVLARMKAFASSSVAIDRLPCTPSLSRLPGPFEAASMPDANSIDRLAAVARAARAVAYAPYSKFCVGAAVLLDNGVIGPGANVENASYGLTCCAERVAMFAVRTQHAQAGIVALAVSCGACRQVMVEFIGPDTPIWIDGVGTHKLSDLLPTPFKL
jgi:cytidine deaminase